MINEKSSIEEIFVFYKKQYEQHNLFEINDMLIDKENRIFINVWEWNLSKLEFGKSICLRNKTYKEICLSFQESNPINTKIYLSHKKIYSTDDHKLIKLTCEKVMLKINSIKTFA